MGEAAFVELDVHEAGAVVLVVVVVFVLVVVPVLGVLVVVVVEPEDGTVVAVDVLSTGFDVFVTIEVYVLVSTIMVPLFSGLVTGLVLAVP